jgi:hypothetical protein
MKRSCLQLDVQAVFSLSSAHIAAATREPGRGYGAFFDRRGNAVRCAAPLFLAVEYQLRTLWHWVTARCGRCIKLAYREQPWRSARDWIGLSSTLCGRHVAIT